MALVFSGVLALFFAGLQDGPDGRLGRYVWTVTAALTAALLRRRASVVPGEQVIHPIRWAGHKYLVAVVVHHPERSRQEQPSAHALNCEWVDSDSVLRLWGAGEPDEKQNQWDRTHTGDEVAV